MKLTRIFSGLAPAIAVAAVIGLAAPIAPMAQTNPPATDAAPAAARLPQRRQRRGGEARSAGDAGLRRSFRCGSRDRQIRSRRRRAGCADELYAERRRHGLDAHLGGAGPDDDDPGSRTLLRRHGAQEERRRHGDDELRHHLSRDGRIRHRHLFDGLHFRHSLRRRIESRVPPGDPQRHQ